MERPKKLKCEIFRDSMQNYKKYAIPPAQLVIADVPYNVGNNFYGSNPMWYNGGDNKNGESKLAGKAAFNSDFNFNLYEYFHFCSKMLKKDDKRPSERGKSSDSPCMIVFCSWEQQFTLLDAAKQYGFGKYIPLVFIKNYSPQVLKANMRVVGACEYALLLYRDKLPKFRNTDFNGQGHMVFNWFQWERDGANVPKIHPAQKSVKVLKRLIETFTDEGDVVIDPCCGSGSALRAAHEFPGRFYQLPGSHRSRSRRQGGRMMETGKIRCIVKRPDETYGHMTNISCSLKNLQKTVEGHIETISIGEGITIICNEEGKIRKLQPNFYVGTGYWADVICGTAIIIGTSGEEFCDIPIDFATWKKLLKTWGN